MGLPFLSITFLGGGNPCAVHGKSGWPPKASMVRSMAALTLDASVTSVLQKITLSPSFRGQFFRRFSASKIQDGRRLRRFSVNSFYHSPRPGPDAPARDTTATQFSIFMRCSPVIFFSLFFAHQFIGNHNPLDLVGAFINGRDPGVPGKNRSTGYSLIYPYPPWI